MSKPKTTYDIEVVEHDGTWTYEESFLGLRDARRHAKLCLKKYHLDACEVRIVRREGRVVR